MRHNMNLIGKNARNASHLKINTQIKNKILKRYILLLKKEKKSILSKCTRFKICHKKELKKKSS